MGRGAGRGGSDTGLIDGGCDGRAGGQACWACIPLTVGLHRLHQSIARATIGGHAVPTPIQPYF